jgi:DNA-binding MarR family transcriptional regulator
MHFLSFAYKRAHYTSLAVARPLAEKFGLTSARFDLLYCVRQLKRGAFQAAIARHLGVSQVTVSRMARALERCGLVRRDRLPSDTRKRRIVLTNEGRRRYYLLLRELRRFSLHRIFVRMFMKFHAQPNVEIAYMKVVVAAQLLRAQMRMLGCRALQRYPDWNRCH